MLIFHDCLFGVLVRSPFDKGIHILILSSTQNISCSIYCNKSRAPIGSRASSKKNDCGVLLLDPHREMLAAHIAINHHWSPGTMMRRPRFAVKEQLLSWNTWDHLGCCNCWESAATINLAILCLAANHHLQWRFWNRKNGLERLERHIWMNHQGWCFLVLPLASMLRRVEIGPCSNSPRCRLPPIPTYKASERAKMKVDILKNKEPSLTFDAFSVGHRSHKLPTTCNYTSYLWSRDHLALI